MHDQANYRQFNLLHCIFSTSDDGGGDDDDDDDDDDDNAGFVYLNETEVDDGVTADQLGITIKTYVKNVYESGGQDLYDVLLYQYRHVQHDWTAVRADQERAAVRHLLMQLLADGHQVNWFVTLLVMFHFCP